MAFRKKEGEKKMYTDITFQTFESNSRICKLHIEYYQSSDKHLSVYYRLDII